MTDEELVLAFFDQRRADVDREMAERNGRPWQASPEVMRWEELFHQLFNACEELDSVPESENKATPVWIDAATFRERIETLLPGFERFELLEDRDDR